MLYARAISGTKRLPFKFSTEPGLASIDTRITAPPFDISLLGNVVDSARRVARRRRVHPHCPPDVVSPAAGLVADGDSLRHWNPVALQVGPLENDAIKPVHHAHPNTLVKAIARLASVEWPEYMTRFSTRPGTHAHTEQW